jgi:hypothetical protein
LRRRAFLVVWVLYCSIDGKNKGMKVSTLSDDRWDQDGSSRRVAQQVTTNHLTATRSLWAKEAICGFLTLCLMGSTFLAHAQAPTLSDPSVYMTIDGPAAASETPGTFSYGGVTEAVTYSVAPFTVSDSTAGFGTASLIYFFSVNGPANTLVPLDINLTFQATALNTSVGGAASAIQFSLYQNNASFSFQGVNYTNTGYNEANICLGVMNPCYGAPGLNGGWLNFLGTPGVPQGVSGLLQMNVMSNTAVEVDQWSTTDLVQGSGTGAPYTSSGLDPFISIDPSFTDANEFSIALSPGVGNGDIAPVPLPSSIWLAVSGLAGLGLFRRRAAAE